MQPEIQVGSQEELERAFAGLLGKLAAAAIARRNRFAWALTGGSTAAAFLPRLASARVDWTRTHLFWGDERAVPAGDARANFALAMRHFPALADVPGANCHRLPADHPDLDVAAAAAERELIGLLGEPPRLDLLWLGVGEDGHVASLFPGSPLLEESRRYVAAVRDSPKPPAGRLTLTLPAIAAARAVVLTALGDAKAAAVGAALREPDSRSPLALAIAAAERGWLLLDPAAAGAVPNRFRRLAPRGDAIV